MVTKSACVNALLKVRYKWNEHPYFRLFVYIVATSLVLYWQFIFGDNVFAFYDGAGDTLECYTKIYEFIASNIRNSSWSSYSFQMGYGESTFGYYLWLFRPFDLISIVIGIVFGQEYIYDSLIYVFILKQVCAGLLCFCFLKNFNFTNKSSMIAAYLYSFSGYFSLVGVHYAFATNPVCFILMIYFIEKIIKGNNRIYIFGGLLYVTTFTVANGALTAYESLLAAGFYALFRSIYLYGRNIKIIIQKLGLCLIFVSGGILMLLPFLMVSAGDIIGSNRLNISTNILAFNSPMDIRTAVLRLFTNYSDGNANNFFGSWYSTVPRFPYFFSVLLVPILAQYVVRIFTDKASLKEKIFRLIPVFLLIFTIASCFISLVFSFFVPHYDSYVYVFYPFFAFAFAYVLDKVRYGKFNRTVNIIVMVICSVIILWGGFSSYNKGIHFSMTLSMLSAVILILGCLSIDTLYLLYKNKYNDCSHQNNICKTVFASLAVLLALNLISENCFMFYYERKALTKNDTHYNMLTHDVVNNINNFENENFIRFETNYMEGRIYNRDGRMYGYCYPLIYPIRATSFFNSAVNVNIIEFYQKLFSSTNNLTKTNYQDACRSVNNATTEDLLGIKYLLLTADPKRNGWEKIEEYPEQGVALYQNMGINSTGLFFDSYVTQKKADEMTFDERAIGLGTRLVIDDPAENIDEFALQYSEDSDLNNNFPSAIISDSFLMYNGSIDNVELTDAGYNVRATMSTNDSNLSFTLNSDIINNRNDSTQITFKLKDNSFVKNIVYLDFDSVWKEIPVTPQNVNNEWQYTLIVPQTATALALCGQTPCQYDVNISSKTVASTYINEEIQLDNPKRGNIVTGTVNAQKNSLLYLPIPFDKYWNAYIDGEKVDIMKANYAFMAVPVTAGQHSVTFIYSNKTYHTFRKVSIAAFILYNGFFVFCFIVKYRRKKKGEKK